MLNQILTLLKKDLLLETRLKYPFAGICLYLVCTVYIIYLSMHNLMNVTTWNAIFWVVLLFVSVNAIAKSFIQEDDRSSYYYFLVSPHVLLISKLIYNSLYQWVLVSISIICFFVFLGNPIVKSELYLMNLMVGSLGISVAFTTISTLASKTKNQAIMMVILGFPMVIPVLLLSLSNSKQILFGANFDAIKGNFFSLLSIIAVMVAVSFVLFPYTRKG